MWKYAVLFFVVDTVIAQSTNSSYRIVKIAQGLVRGHLDPEGGVYVFYNIPYASAPSGIDRFKAPLAPTVWMNTFDAIDRGIACPQSGSFTSMQEDCLVANIYIPDTNATNLPVLVHFRGGAYQFGHGNAVSWKSLVQIHRLIVITFNYRLGAHGFLCLGTEGAPGNAGLKDQVALLRWVKANIASFGGNPEDVTLIGCSAGAGSIDVLTLSQSTRGLFNKVAIESGAVMGIVGVQPKPILNAQHYAKLLNFTNVDDLDALEEFYRTIPLHQLSSEYDSTLNYINGMVQFAPCVERDLGLERILEDAPLNIIRQGNYNKVPLIYGFANRDGFMRVPTFDTWKDMMNENFADFLPYELYFETQEEKERVAERVRQFYFGNETITEDSILSYLEYYTDTLFGYPMLKGAKTRIESLDDTIYLFDYSLVHANSPHIPYTDEKAADHCDLINALLDEDESIISEEYRRMKAITRECWMNFFMTGVPSVQSGEMPVWLPSNAQRAPYMNFGKTIELKETSFRSNYTALWDSIYEQYYRDPSPPQSAPSSAISLEIISITRVLILVIVYLINK